MDFMKAAQEYEAKQAQQNKENNESKEQWVIFLACVLQVFYIVDLNHEKVTSKATAKINIWTLMHHMSTFVWFVAVRSI